MQFPKTPLSDIHSGYLGNPEIWQEFFIDFIDNYEKYKAECTFFEKSDFSQLKSEYLDLINSSRHLETSNLLNKAEKKLDLALPKSYRDFVLAGGLEISKSFEYDFITYRKPCPISEVNFLYKDRDGYHSYEDIIQMNDESYEDGTFSLDKAFHDYYQYVNYFNLFKYTNDEIGILDVLRRKVSYPDIGYFSRGTLPQHKKFSKQIVNLSSYLSHILLPFERTQDGEYEAWFFEDSNFYKFKSFAEMYTVDLLGGCDRILGKEGMNNLYQGALSKMFSNMPSLL